MKQTTISFTIASSRSFRKGTRERSHKCFSLPSLFEHHIAVRNRKTHFTPEGATQCSLYPQHCNTKTRRLAHIHFVHRHRHFHVNMRVRSTMLPHRCLAFTREIITMLQATMHDILTAHPSNRMRPSSTHRPSKSNRSGWWRGSLVLVSAAGISFTDGVHGSEVRVTPCPTKRKLP